MKSRTKPWGVMRREMLRYIKRYGPRDAETIADALNCTSAYVRTTAKRNGIELPSRREMFTLLLEENEQLRTQLANANYSRLAA